MLKFQINLFKNLAKLLIVLIKAEVAQLHKENRNLRSGEEGATGGPNTYATSTTDLKTQRFVQELRNAASTAEMSLR